MKKRLFNTLGILVFLALFYQQIILVGCKIALYCFLPKTFSYQKIVWDKNVLRIQGLIKQKNELSVDCIDLFYQEGAFHIRVLHPQYLADNKVKSPNILGAALALNRFFSVEVHHGVLELNQLRYYFSLLPITHKKLELKLAMDPDPLYPALLTLHHSSDSQIYLSIKSQEVKHLLPLTQLVGYFNRDLNYYAKISVEANAAVKSDGYIQDIHVKTTLANVKVQQTNKQFCCDQIEANLRAEEVYLKNLWHSFKGHFQLENGSYALLSQNLEWQNQLMHIEADLWITDQSKAILSAIAVHEKASFPLILETSAIHKDQQGIGIKAVFSDPVDKTIQGNLGICLAQEGIIEWDIQKFELKHLDWARSCFSLPRIDSSISYKWKNCLAKIAMLFSDQVLQSINLTQFQAKDVSVDHSSHKFFIKDVQMQGKWDALKSQIKEGFCQLEQVEGLNIVIEYPGAEEAIYAHVQGDLSSMLGLPLVLPVATDLTIHENKVEGLGSIVNMPFSVEAVFLKPLSLEDGLQPIQGHLKLKDLTEEQYKPWLANFLPELIIKGNYQLECLFDTDKVVIGVEADKVYLEHFYKTIEIPKVSDLSFQYQKGKWGLSCPRLEGKLSYKQDAYVFSTALDAVYPKFHIQDLFLKTEDFSMKVDLLAQYQDLWNLQLQIVEIQKQEKNLIDEPISAEIVICPESKVNLSNFTVIADLKNLSLPISSGFKLEEGMARIEWTSSVNELCVTKANARLIQDKKVFCNLQIDSLIRSIDSFSPTHFTGSLQVKELPIIQVQGVLLHPGVDKWQIDCNLGLVNSKNWRIQLATEDLFKQYDFSCLAKDITISGKKLFSQWHVDQIQSGSLMASGVFTSDEKTLHCKNLQGSYEGYPFLASGVFDLQTHTICGQIDCNCFSLKSSPFICEYSVEQGFFSKQINLVLQDLRSSETLANIFCHSTSYQNKTWESIIDFSLPAFHGEQVTWQHELIGSVELKKMPGLIRLRGGLKQGDLNLAKQLVKYRDTTFSIENTHFTLNSELNLGEKPFWGTLWFDNPAGAFEISDKPLQPGLKGCFSIESNECKLHTIKGKACGITADLKTKETNHLQGTLQIHTSDCASFIPLLEKIIKPLELEAQFIYQGEISEQGCRGLLQADQVEIKGISVNKFSAGIEFSPKELQIYDFRLDDEAGSLFAKTISCKNLNDWELWIPEVEIKQLQLDHVLKKAKPFIMDILVKDIQAQLSDLQTLHGLGQCKFQYLKQDEFFEIPLEILSKIGLDLRSFMPVEGEFGFKLQESRCYLTQLAKTFSKNGHCKFALAKRKKHTSYIGFDGSLSIDLELKQKKLLKVMNPFTFTVRGNVDHPKYGLVLLKK
ncbi:hypothetical protein [Candidatus Rhabdochlamydia sp. T3358]|uniref:hypothetical protein n=1 Tax=Candidatus Rhabdochlamydia sp. T3358 TaxID=2099795 RepID=UPI0010B054D7|nr:hypothetical protein [Candidatus Rhabdochlamydia sp. T3358]VHO01921.1 hypothetical protein RHT_00310 [Candidatus Rhabdochlamydia sp. T3358]